MPSRRESTGCEQVRAALLAIRGADGQGTLEYALVLFAFLSMVAGMGAIWNALDAGLLIEHALQSASHHIASAAPGAFADVFMY